MLRPNHKIPSLLPDPEFCSNHFLVCVCVCLVLTFRCASLHTNTSCPLFKIWYVFKIFLYLCFLPQSLSFPNDVLVEDQDCWTCKVSHSVSFADCTLMVQFSCFFYIFCKSAAGSRGDIWLKCNLCGKTRCIWEDCRRQCVIASLFRMLAIDVWCINLLHDMLFSVITFTSGSLVYMPD